MKTETLEAIGAAGNKATIIGGSIAMAGKMSAADIAAYVGAAVAIVGLLITWYYKREANRRHAAEAEDKRKERALRMELMRATGRPIYPSDTDLGALEADE